MAAACDPQSIGLWGLLLFLPVSSVKDQDDVLLTTRNEWRSRINLDRCVTFRFFRWLELTVLLMMCLVFFEKKLCWRVVTKIMPMPVEMRHDKITDLMLRTGEEDVKRVCEFVTRDCGQRSSSSSSSSKISNNQPGVGWLEVCMRTTNVFVGAS